MSAEHKSDPAVRHALRVHTTVELSDYHTFFRLYRETPYLGKCIAKHIKNRIRSRALRVILRAYKPSVPLQFLQKQLGYRVEDVDSLLRAGNGDDDDESDSDDWEGYAAESRLVVTQEPGIGGDPGLSMVDLKASLDALIAAGAQ